MAGAEGSENAAAAPAGAAADPIQPMAQPQNTAQPFAQYPSAYGQPFQSYHQYQPGAAVPGAAPPQQQQQQMRPPPVEETKGWIYSKAGLHASGAVCSIISIALAFSIQGGSFSKYVAWFTTPVPFIALIWSVSELIVRYTRKFQSGIHPGAHVALCLLIWLCASITGGMFTTYSVIHGESGYDDDDYDDSNYCTTSKWNSDTNTYDYSNCSSSGRSHGDFYPQFIALAVFTWFMWIIYFVLFVGACIDTHKRNTAARRPIMIVQPGSYWPQPAQGWQQLPPGSAGGQRQQDIPLQNRGASQENPNEKGNQVNYYA